jgi:CheY-like chemotaxis protein
MFDAGSKNLIWTASSSSALSGNPEKNTKNLDNDVQKISEHFRQVPVRTSVFSIGSTGSIMRIVMARILVIEDDQVMRSVLSRYLKHVGYDVPSASNRLEGVEVFRSCPKFIDLVLTDLRMPVITGNEAVRQIRETRRDAKVICITGFSEDVRLKGVSMLEKPFSLKALHHSILHLLTAATTDLKCPRQSDY